MNGSAWTHRSQWKEIGLSLGVDKGTLDAIERSRQHVVEDCFTDMIAVWLKSSPQPKREDLLQAIHILQSARGTDGKTA